MKFSKTHEWIELEGKIGIVGITDFAQKQIGEILHVELPELNKKVGKEEEVAVLESNKAASGIYSPVAGKIIEVNETLLKDPTLINKSPQKDGWIFKLEIADLKEYEALLDKPAY